MNQEIYEELLFARTLITDTEDFESRFEDILTMVIPPWIINPYGDIEQTNVIIQEELTELSTNEELKVQFKNGYQQFWLQNNIPVTYPVIYEFFLHTSYKVAPLLPQNPPPMSSRVKWNPRSSASSKTVLAAMMAPWNAFRSGLCPLLEPIWKDTPMTFRSKYRATASSCLASSGRTLKTTENEFGEDSDISFCSLKEIFEAYSATASVSRNASSTITRQQVALAVEQAQSANSTSAPALPQPSAEYAAEDDASSGSGTSKELQNDLLDCSLEVCHEEIIKHVNRASYLAIIADETTDISGKTQLIHYKKVEGESNINETSQYVAFKHPAYFCMEQKNFVIRIDILAKESK
ncbi:unnamed protein product [Acanthoscelides obtectus]|uniref:DUF4371 domain-containing protein n=1 Tax=Acanthoscelides obtectus TaxID=200917 RepID=A0A9P0QAF1_ACAOB|nr:unnamed protein product [Acanthoscelides obtectus]CAK1671585.1 hypothetical protein AOBTE_LOCUS28340 [Acanthoscelides obtectus]